MAPIEITAGFMPLTDSAILVVAHENGFAEAEGISIRLVRETSWANVRDRMAVGHFDAAHTLAPMPIAANLGLTPFDARMIVPMAMGLGGNAVTVSANLALAMEAHGEILPLDAAATGRLLKAVVEERKRKQQPLLQFAVVHPHSAHNLELRYWLAGVGIRPDIDIEFAVIPPPFIADALSTGQIDGFCAGEPWNSLAVRKCGARIATVKSAIWASSPEKVLSLREEWAERHPDGAHALVRALYAAARWCGTPANRSELAGVLAGKQYLDKPASIIELALSGEILGLSQIQKSQRDNGKRIDFFEPFARAATFPWQSHALWFYSQMVRWGQVNHGAENAEVARRSYRPDIYRAALGPLDVPVPSASSKVEGALKTAQPVGVTGGQMSLGPDGFFDGKTFDPDKLDEYILGQSDR